MPYRDTLPFKAIGALTLGVELLFFKASWPRVPEIIFGLLFVVVVTAILFGLVILLMNVLLGLLWSRHRAIEAFLLLIWLLAPVSGPIFCFFRPTTKQFQNLKNELRLVCSFAERTHLNNFQWYLTFFFAIMAYRAKYYGPQIALWHFLIVSPFFLAALFYLIKRASRIRRSRTLAQKIAPAVADKSNVGSWSENFVHSYLYDVLLTLALISSLFVV